MLHLVAKVRTRFLEPVRVGLLVIASYCCPVLAQQPRTEHGLVPPLASPSASMTVIVTESAPLELELRPPLGLIETLETRPYLPAGNTATGQAGEFTPSGSFENGSSAERAACAAAQQWMPARLLRARAATLLRAYCDADECEQQAARVLATFLNHQANHQQSMGAAAMLRGLFTRQALAEQMRLLDAASEDLELEHNRLDQIVESGLGSRVDRTQLERSRIKIADTRLQLESRDRQLRDMLRELSPTMELASVDLAKPLQIESRELNGDQLLQRAYSQREDLRAWLHLRGQVNAENVQVYAGMLTTLVGGWSLPLPTVGKLVSLFCKPDFGPLAASFRREIDLAIATQREYIRQDVVEKVHALELAYARIELARQTIESWEARLRQLEQLSELGNGQPEQSSVARVGVADARTAEVLRRLDARLAEIDLAESLGGLAQRCCNGQPWFVIQ